MTVYLQPDKHWVLVEVEESKGEMRAMYVDLNRVDDMVIAWEDRFDTQSREVKAIACTLSSRLQPISLAGKNAKWFHEQWRKYIDLKAEMARNEPPLISSASMKDIGKL